VAHRELAEQQRWRSLPEVIAYAQEQAKVVVVGRRIDEVEETVKNAKTEHRFPATYNRSILYDPA
jgi:hypothetical protein